MANPKWQWVLPPTSCPGPRPPDFGDRIRRMIRIAITPVAYAAIAATLALTSSSAAAST
jgi:hypothetical protein